MFYKKKTNKHFLLILPLICLPNWRMAHIGWYSLLNELGLLVGLECGLLISITFIWFICWIIVAGMSSEDVTEYWGPLVSKLVINEWMLGLFCGWQVNPQSKLCINTFNE